MKKTLFPILLSIFVPGCLFAQTISYPLPVEATEFKDLGTFQKHVFFSTERSNERSDQLWQFDTEAEQFIERTNETGFLLDFQVTPQGVFWAEKERINRFSAGKVDLWFWSGDPMQAPEVLLTTTANKVRLIANSNTHLFFYFDILFYTVDLRTRTVKSLGAAPPPPQNYEGIIWEGRYFWSVSNDNQDHRVYWADPELGVQFFWQAAERVYTFVPLGDRILWREGSRLVRYDLSSPGPEYYYEFTDFDPRSFFFGEWNGARLNDSIYIFPSNTSAQGTEPWRTDGTAEGTFLLKDIATERTGNFIPTSQPRYFHKNNGKVHFMAYTRFDEPPQHWESDGSIEGTIQRTQLIGPEDQVYLGLPVNDSLYLLYVQSKLDGLEPVLFSDDLAFYDIHPGPANSIGSIFPSRWLSLSDGSVVLEAFSAESGNEPWLLTPDQKQKQIADIAPQRAWSNGPILGEVDGIVYYLGGNVDQGYKIYPLDPTKAVESTISSSPINWQQSISPSVQLSASTNWVYSMGLVRATDGSLYSSGSTNLSAGKLMLSRGEQPTLTQDLFADAYVMRMDQEGIAEWLLPLPGSFVRSDAPFITQAPEGGVYVGGRYYRDSQVGATPVRSGFSNAYFAKINTAGQEEWVKTIDLNGGDIFNIRTDDQGFLWAVGLYRSRAYIENVSLNSGIDPAYFVARWSPEGVLDWATTLEPSLDWPSWGPVHATNIDPSGNLWLFLNNMGHNYNAPCDFGTIYGRLVKVSPTGTVLSEQEWSGDDAWYATDLNFTAQGNVLLAGRFRGNLQLGDISLSHKTSECSSAGFIAKIDPSGTAVKVRKLESERIPASIASNTDGTYALAGYQRLPERTSYPGYSHFPFGRKSQKIFTAIYSSTDSLLAERTFLAREEFDAGGFMYLLPGVEDEWVFQGELNGILDTIGTTLPAFGNRHHVQLVAFELPYELPEDESDQSLTEELIQVFPNPTTDYIIIQSEDMDFTQAEIALYNAQGQRLGQAIQAFEPQVFRMRLGDLPVGIYQLVVTLDDQIFSKPIYKSE